MWWAFVFYAIEQEMTSYDLFESENQYRKLVEATGCLVTQVDHNGVFLFVNYAAHHTFGIPPEACVGRSAFDFVHPDDRETTRQAFAEWIEKKVSYTVFENRQVNQTGEIRYISWSIDINYDKKGSVLSVISIGRDITERKKVEQEREKLLETLEAKNDELESILYAVSHDLKTPLVNIQGFGYELSQNCKLICSALANEKISEPVAEALNQDIPNALDYILSSAKKMDSLLTGLLDIFRLTTSAVEISKVDMNELMALVMPEMEYQIIETGAKIAIEPLEPCIGNSLQINRIFTNLITNALKFLDKSRPGQIRVYCTTQNNRNIYCVEDNGIGIAPMHQDKIFDLFYQLEPESQNGDGLGLAIVRQIARKYDGNVWLESESGKGSKFFVSLPRA